MFTVKNKDLLLKAVSFTLANLETEVAFAPVRLVVGNGSSEFVPKDKSVLTKRAARNYVITCLLLDWTVEAIGGDYLVVRFVPHLGVYKVYTKSSDYMYNTPEEAADRFVQLALGE